MILSGSAIRAVTQRRRLLGPIKQLQPASCNSFQSHLVSVQMPYRDPVSSNGVIGLGEMPWLRAVIGTKPQFSHVETWSVNRRKSPMKNDVKGLDGVQSQA